MFTDELKVAVDEYVKQGCAADPSCAVGRRRGWPMNSWCVSNVKDMDEMFRSMEDFDEDISLWDTSQVTHMWSMFNGATAFSGDLSAWDVSQVTNTGAMFYEATSFSSNLSAWNVSKVTIMSLMFSSATSFDSDMSTWDIAQVVYMDSMFSGASSFRQDLCAWVDAFKYSESPRGIFTASSCKYPVDPHPDHRGPFCGSTYQAATVVWSTVSCPCSIGDFMVLQMLLNDLLLLFPSPQ